jgi:hypothetical protein
MRRPVLSVAVLAMAASIAGWLVLRRADPPASPERAQRMRDAPPPEPPRVVSPATAPPPVPDGKAVAPVPAPAPPGEAPAPTAGEAHLPGAEPHPITPAHERIFRENNLIGQLNGALDVKDAEGVRRLLGQYRAQYPDDPNQLQTGYAIIADCLDHPGPNARAAGQRYYDMERGSILRRMVDRYCLQP